MEIIRRDRASKAYFKRFVPIMLAYCVLVFESPLLIRATHATGPLLWGLAVLPALPLIGVFWVIGQYFLDLRDDYVRLLEVRKALVATGLTMSLASGWGFLEIYAQAPHIAMFFVPVIWFAGLGIGAFVNFMIERRDGRV